MKRQRELAVRILRELPNAQVKFVRNKKHVTVTVTVGDKTLDFTMAVSPSDVRGDKNLLASIKRAFK